MQMTEEFSRVHEMFEEVKNIAMMGGRWPSKILLGPDEMRAWDITVHKNPDFKFGVEYTFEGFPVRPMAHPGVAVETMGLPVIKGCVWYNGPQN